MIRCCTCTECSTKNKRISPSIRRRTWAAFLAQLLARPYGCLSKALLTAWVPRPKRCNSNISFGIFECTLKWYLGEWMVFCRAKQKITWNYVDSQPKLKLCCLPFLYISSEGLCRALSQLQSTFICPSHFHRVQKQTLSSLRPVFSNSHLSPSP